MYRKKIHYTHDFVGAVRCFESSPTMNKALMDGDMSVGTMLYDEAYGPRTKPCARTEVAKALHRSWEEQLRAAANKLPPQQLKQRPYHGWNRQLPKQPHAAVA